MSTGGHQDGCGTDGAVGSVGGAINKYLRGDGTELGELVSACFDLLLTNARRRLGSVARTDAEGLVQSAFASFLAGARNGSFPELRHRVELRRLLITILRRKASHAVRDLTTETAGRGKVQNEPESGLEAEGREGDPAEEASCREWLEHMRSKGLVDAAKLILDGCDYHEIAESLGITKSKARRLITLVHKESRIFFHLEEKSKK